MGYHPLLVLYSYFQNLQGMVLANALQVATPGYRRPIGPGSICLYPFVHNGRAQRDGAAS